MRRKILVGLITVVIVASTVDANVRSLISQEGMEIIFIGTAIEYFSFIGAWGWSVQVDEVVTGPSKLEGQIMSVYDAPVFSPHGYIDPDIEPGDKVEVYGYYQEGEQGEIPEMVEQLEYGIPVALFGSEDYYIIKISDEEESEIKVRGTIFDIIEVTPFCCLIYVEEVISGPIITEPVPFCIDAFDNGSYYWPIEIDDKVEIYGIVTFDEIMYIHIPQSHHYIKKIEPNPCKDVTCGTVCRGTDLWQQTCSEGECIDAYLVERNSQECGACPEIYDPDNPNCNLDCPDFDEDGVPNCKDKCADTPKWMSRNLSVDFEGCIYCLDKESKCAVAVTTLSTVPTFGLENILLDFCEIMVKALDGNMEEVIDEVKSLIIDIFFTIVRILSTPVAPGVGDKAIGGLQTLLTCLPVLSDSEMETAYKGSVQQMAAEGLDVLSVYIGSPVVAEIKDDYGNILSTSNMSGIPNSSFITVGDNQIGLIANPSDNYTIEIQGTEDGEYDLMVRIVQKGKITAQDWSNVNIREGDLHQYTVNIDSARGISRISLRTVGIYWQWIFLGLAIISGVGIGAVSITSYSAARRRKIVTLLLLGLLGALIGWVVWYLISVGVIS